MNKEDIATASPAAFVLQLLCMLPVPHKTMVEEERPGIRALNSLNPLFNSVSELSAPLFFL